MSLFRTIIAHRATHIAFAFVALGGWAFWANRMHEMPAPLIAGLLQGVISATITIGLQWIIHRVYGRTRNAGLSMITAALFSLATISSLHALAGTPEIMATIAIPWMVGCIYVIAYTSGLHRRSRA